MRATLFGALLATWLAAPASGQAPPEIVADRLYRASVTAADASLRLHETATAKKWLAEAPASHRQWEWRYLDRRAAVATLVGHSGPVWTAAFAPDGTRLATSSSDGTLRGWDLATTREVWKVEGVGRGIHVAAWHPDGTSLASASWQLSRERGVWGVLRVWDATTGKPVAAWEHG